MKNIVLFAGVAAGTALLIAGLAAIDRGERGGGLYLVGAALAFVLAIGPGRRLQRAWFAARPDE